jgi:hypothetical protein
VGCLWHDYQGEPCLITHGFRYHFIGRMRPKGGSANNVRLHIHVTDTWCVSVACSLKLETCRNRLYEAFSTCNLKMGSYFQDVIGQVRAWNGRLIYRNGKLKKT